MRTTVTLEDRLVEEAQRLTGTKVGSRLLNQALESLVQQESARRLAALGGSDPDASAVPRRRPGQEEKAA